MLRTFLKSKIHRATVKKANLHYEGSIGIDENLLKAVDIMPGEKVHVVNLHNGERFETYVVGEKKNSGLICLYGPAARLGQVHDIVIILSYAQMDAKEAKNFKQKVAYVNSANKILKIK